MNVNHENTFVPTTSTDIAFNNGSSSTISTKYMTITMMEKFKNKSFEELHLENYNTKVSGFGGLIGKSSNCKQNDMDDSVSTENNQMNDIKDLVDELVNTLCKMILKMNHIVLKNQTASAVNEKQENNKAGSFPSACVEIRPTFLHTPKFDPFLSICPSTFNPTSSTSTAPSTTTTNSFFKCTSPTNNFSFTPTANPFINTTMPTANKTIFSNPVESKKTFFSNPNSNSSTLTNTSWPPSSTTKKTAIRFVKQSAFNKTPTAETKSFWLNDNSKVPTFNFKPASSSLNEISTAQPKPFTLQSTFPPRSKLENDSNSQPFKFSSDPFLSKLSTISVTTNSLTSSSFNNNAKASSNLVTSNFNSKNDNSFPIQTSHTPLFKPTSSNSNSIWNDKFANPQSSNLFNTKSVLEKSGPMSISQSITLPLLTGSNPTLTSVSKENTNKETVERKEINDDELVSSIVNCIESLKMITFQAQKSKLIGICEHSDTIKANILKSVFIQLRVMNSRFLHYEKSAFVSESTGISNTTLKNNILVGKPFNPQLYYGAIALCCLKEDIDSLPFGDATTIGDDGIELSDAQKQKIAFARAFYADQDIYFLNNAFNKIDSKDARFIFETLILGALKNKVIILMDDKPSYFGHCDKVYILNKGKVVEESDHKSLLKTNTFYASLIHKNNSDNVVAKDTTMDDKSSNANKNPRILVRNAFDIKLQTFIANQIRQKSQSQVKQNINTVLEEVIEKAVDNIETRNTSDQQMENIESPENSEVKVNDDQEPTPKIQQENQISNIEPKISNQKDDKEEEITDATEDKTDYTEETSSVSSENDLSGFEIY